MKPTKGWDDKTLITVEPSVITPAVLAAFAKLAEAVNKEVHGPTYIEHTYAGLTLWRPETDGEKADRMKREAEYEAARKQREADKEAEQS